jgi:hypothetical protein
MWLLAVAIFVACKWLTWSRRKPGDAVPLWRYAAYLLAWPGLDADAFLHSAVSKRPTVREWLFATSKLALGLGLLFGIVRTVPSDLPYLAGWVGMVGIAFVLHFGLFHLLSCYWRTFGVEAKALMNWPIAAASLSEFWGRRWNTAFRDLTHRFLFRPLAARSGGRWAVFVGFVISGLVHDAVISIPAGGGYGGPTAYFLIQGVGLFLERSRFGKRMGRPFTIAVLLGPAVLLFHRPFVLEVVVPFLHVLGAIP